MNHKSTLFTHLVLSIFLISSPCNVLASVLDVHMFRDVGIFDPQERWDIKLTHTDPFNVSNNFNVGNSTATSSTLLISGFFDHNKIANYDLTWISDNTVSIDRLDYDFDSFVIFWEPIGFLGGSPRNATYTTGTVSPDGISTPTFTETTDIFYGSSFLTPAQTPVPVPAAVWLMGSGLLSLIGFSRKTSLKLLLHNFTWSSSTPMPIEFNVPTQN